MTNRLKFNPYMAFFLPVFAMRYQSIPAEQQYMSRKLYFTTTVWYLCQKLAKIDIQYDIAVFFSIVVIREIILRPKIFYTIYCNQSVVYKKFVLKIQ